MAETLYFGRASGPSTTCVATGVLVGAAVGAEKVALGDEGSIVGMVVAVPGTAVGRGELVAGGGSVGGMFGLMTCVGLKIAVMVKSGVGKINGVGVVTAGRLQASTARNSADKINKMLL